MAFSWGNTSTSNSSSWGTNTNNNNNTNTNNSNSNSNSNTSGFSWGNNNSNNNQNQNTNNNNSSAWSFGNTSNTNNNSNTRGSTNNSNFSWGGEGSTNNNNNNTNNNNNSTFNLNTNGWGSSSNSNVLNPNNDYVVNDITSDCISCIRYHPQKDIFSVGSWDNTITIYEQFGNQTRKLGQQKHDKPILCSCWHTNGNSLFSAGCDNTIKQWTPQQNNITNIGQHQSPIRCIEYCNQLNAVISGSWDMNMSFWDIRNPSSAQKVFNYNFGSKIYAMHQRGQYLVVALSNQDIQTFDLRQYQNKMSSLQEQIKNHNQNNNNSSSKQPVSLKTQIRSISIFPDCNGYAASSIGGRVIIKHFNSQIGEKKDFSFKCHRQKDPSSTKRHTIEYVFAVNVVKFHDPTGVFMTAGDDGEMVVWDKDNRNKLHTFKQMKMANYSSNNNDRYTQKNLMPVVAAEYSTNGKFLCYATSYNWHKGSEFLDRNQQKTQIYIHQVQPKEVEKLKK